jgi:preprotein translocase subunit SecD
MTDRRRNTFVLLIVAALIVLSLLVTVGIPSVVKPKKTRLGLELKGGVELTYQGRPTAQSKVNKESLERAIDIMRKRVDALGVADPEIQISGKDEIVVALPNVSNSERAQAQVGQTAQLYFYDWEPNVIGPDGKPAPTEASVTGGESAASSTQRPARVPGGAACRQTAADPARRRHDAEPGLYGPAEGRLHLRQLVSARHQERNDAVRRRVEPQTDPRRRKPNRTCTRTATNRRRARSRRWCT